MICCPHMLTCMGWKVMLPFVLAGLHPDSTLEMTSPCQAAYIQSTPALDGQVASSHTRQALHVFKLVFAGWTDDPCCLPEMLYCACR
jgi:hypothetical protein